MGMHTFQFDWKVAKGKIVFFFAMPFGIAGKFCRNILDRSFTKDRASVANKEKQVVL